MGLIKDKMIPSSRMGMVWTLGCVEGLIIIELGSMGHTVYQQKIFNGLNPKTRGLFYSTHMSETEIAFGTTKKLELAVKDLLRDKKGDAVAIVPGSNGIMTGIDLDSLAEELKEIVHLPVFTVKKGGFQYSFQEGVEEALYELVSNLVSDEDPDICKGDFELRNVKKGKESYGIIGLYPVPLETEAGAVMNVGEERLRELEGIMEARGFQERPLCIISGESSVQQIKKISSLSKLIVLSKEAEKAAMWLKENTNIEFERFYQIQKN